MGIYFESKEKGIRKLNVIGKCLKSIFCVIRLLYGEDGIVGNIEFLNF